MTGSSYPIGSKIEAPFVWLDNVIPGTIVQARLLRALTALSTWTYELIRWLYSSEFLWFYRWPPELLLYSTSYTTDHSYRTCFWEILLYLIFRLYPPGNTKPNLCDITRGYIPKLKLWARVDHLVKVHAILCRTGSIENMLQFRQNGLLGNHA